MGCFFLKKKLRIKVVDTTDEGIEFGYLRPKGRLILKLESVYNVPKIDILFDDCYVNSVRLWPKAEKARIFCR